MPRKKPKYENLTVNVPAYIVDSLNPGDGCTKTERKLFARRIRLIDYLARSTTKSLSYRTMQTIVGQKDCKAEVQFLIKAGVLKQMSKGYHLIKKGKQLGAAAKYDLVIDPENKNETHYTLRADNENEYAVIAEIKRGHRRRTSSIRLLNNWSGVRLCPSFDNGKYINDRRERLLQENKTELAHWTPKGTQEKLSIQDHLMRLMGTIDDIMLGREDKIWAIKSVNCGRLTTTWTVIPRDLREYLVDAKGQRLVEVDLRACHPHLLPMLLSEWTRQLVEAEGFGRNRVQGKGFRRTISLKNDNKTLAEQVVDLQAEIHDFQSSLDHEDWYAHLADSIPGSTRADVKSASMYWLNHALDDRCWGMMQTVVHYFEDRWPRIDKLMRIKSRTKLPTGQYAKSYVACQLMLLESRIVLPIAKKLSSAGKTCISIHDALLVSPEDAQEAKELLDASYPGAKTKTKIKSVQTVPSISTIHTTTTKQENTSMQLPKGIHEMQRGTAKYWTANIPDPEKPGRYMTLRKSQATTSLDAMLAIVAAAKGEEYVQSVQSEVEDTSVPTQEVTVQTELCAEAVESVQTPVPTSSEIAELRLLIERQNNQMISDYGAMRDWSAQADARIAKLEKKMDELTAWAGQAHSYIEKLLTAGSQSVRADMSAGPSELQQAALVLQSHQDLVQVVMEAKDEASRIQKSIYAIHKRLDPLENAKKIKDQSLDSMADSLTHMRNTVDDCRSIQTIQGQQIKKIQDRIKATDEEAHRLRMSPHKEASAGLAAILAPEPTEDGGEKAPCGRVVDGKYVPGWLLPNEEAVATDADAEAA